MAKEEMIGGDIDIGGGSELTDTPIDTSADTGTECTVLGTGDTGIGDMADSTVDKNDCNGLESDNEAVKDLTDANKNDTLENALESDKNFENHFSTDKEKELYDRPSDFRKGMRDQVWEQAISESNDGIVRDPNTQEPMESNKSWDMGHRPGYEFKKHQQSAMNRGIDRKQFLDEYNNPTHYRPEIPRFNRSHKGEDKTDTYYGP